MAGESSSAIAGVRALERLVEPIEGQCFRTEPLSRLLPGRVARRRALGNGNQPGDHSNDEHHCNAGEQHPEPPVHASLPLGLTTRAGDARIEELALTCVQRVGMLLRPFRRSAQPGAAVEVARVPVTRFPELCGVADRPVQSDAFSILLQPVTQGRPLADEDLVSDLRGALAQRDQPGLREAIEQRFDLLARAVLGHELVDADSASGVLDPFAELGEAQEEVAHQPVLIGRNRLDHRVGSLGDSGRHTAALPVRLDRHRASVAVLPGHPQGVGQQRQRTGLAGDVAQDQLDQAGLEAQSGEARRLDDRSLELGVAHRTQEDLVASDGPSELCVAGELAVHVSAYGDHDGRAEREQTIDERVAACAVVTQREELLELVDDDQLVGGVRARRAAGSRRG